MLPQAAVAILIAVAISQITLGQFRAEEAEEADGFRTPADSQRRPQPPSLFSRWLNRTPGPQDTRPPAAAVETASQANPTKPAGTPQRPATSTESGVIARAIPNSLGGVPSPRSSTISPLPSIADAGVPRNGHDAVVAPAVRPALGDATGTTIAAHYASGSQSGVPSINEGNFPAGHSLNAQSAGDGIARASAEIATPGAEDDRPASAARRPRGNLLSLFGSKGSDHAPKPRRRTSTLFSKLSDASTRDGSSEHNRASSRDIASTDEATWISDQPEAVSGDLRLAGSITASLDGSAVRQTAHEALVQDGYEFAGDGGGAEGAYGGYSTYYGSAGCGPGCGPGGCDRCSGFGCLWGGGERMYVRLQYLNWQMKGYDAPPLVTESPAGVPQNEAGVLGFATTILYPTRTLNSDFREGGRLTAGYWLASDDVFGLEADWYQLETSRDTFLAFSDGDPILARPFTNSALGGQDSALIAFGGAIVNLPPFGMVAVNLEGQVSVESTSRLRSGGLAFRGVLNLGGNWANYRVDYLAGYRYWDLRESLSVIDVIYPVGAPFLLGTTITGEDHFIANNTFHGGELGVSSRVQCGRFSTELTGRVALGNMHQEMLIDGRTTVFTPTPPESTVSDGSLLAQPSNGGLHRRDRLTVIPEVSVNLNYHITKYLRFTAGYTAIWVSDVARPGDHIDTTLDPTQFGNPNPPPDARPAFNWASSDVIIHGVNGGVEFRY